MTAECDIFYIKAPFAELARLAPKLIKMQIPFEFNGSIEMKIESRPNWSSVLQGMFRRIERRCREEKKVYGLEFYPSMTRQDIK